MSRNRLNEETSPYLLQHKDNPVHWRAWGDEALEEARQSGRPILLSVGYAACHWCHVMAHESFEDEATAALMNDLYINIKVDREERPDLDAIYQSALAMMGEQGGWPLTMFLTPDGEPFWGGTYFPPERRYGRPGFPEVLSGIAESYRSKPKQVLENAATLRAGLVKLGAPPKGMDGQGAMS
ncbi:MAG: thioredoxin domain-containing protein, partial [Rhodospirillales bacterium]|nr:thioredoxin domain-containing protein [Rhodospirillales bacterium]